MSDRGTVNMTLTNYARGIAQDKASALANFIAPFVVTGFESGQYKEFKDSNDFQVYDTRRPIGGPSNRITFDADDKYYNCSPQGLEAAKDDVERRKSGNADPLKIAQAKIKAVVNGSIRSHEKKVFDTLAASVTAAVGLGNWTSSAVDPVDEIDALIDSISLEIGRSPNRMVISQTALKVMRANAKMKERLKGVTTQGLNLPILAGMLLNPAIDIRVGVLSFDQAKRGASATSKARIMGADLYLFFGQDDPSEYDPSFAKTFSSGEGSIDAVTEYRDNPAHSDIYSVDWSEDIKVTAPIAAGRISVS